MRETKWCPKCKHEVQISDFGVNKGRRDGLTVYCMACHRQVTNESRLKWRLKALEALGGCCASCGFADHRALHIDHIDGDGGADRKAGKHVTVKVMRQLAEGNLEGHRFQVLCANCNTIKVHEAGERIGKRSYERKVPVKRDDRPNARWTPEQRAAQAAKTKAMWADPETRAAFLANQAKVHADPKVRATRSKVASENMRRRWASGETPSRKRATAESP